MKKLALFAGACSLALAMSGCANGVTSAVNGINAITGALSSPSANQAAANLKAGAQALVCFVGSVSSLSTTLATQLKAGTALIRDSEDVYVVSSTVCTTLGGAVIGPETVPASATGS